MLKLKIKKAVIGLSICIFVYLYFSNSSLIISSVQKALYLCYSTIIPSLFIFMVFCVFLSNSSVKNIVGYPFSPIFKLIKINSLTLISYVILSNIGGFAIGGYFLSKIEKEFKISKNALGVISILISGNSPAFIIFVIGIGVFKNHYIGIMIYISTILSAYITAFIFSFIFKYPVIYKTKEIVNEGLGFLDSVSTAVKAILNICGIVIITYTLCNVILLYISDFASLSIISLLEVTTARMLAKNLPFADIYIFCAIIAITPLSAILQLKSYFTDKVSFKILYLSKLIHLPLSMLILKILVNIFPYAATTAAPINKTLVVFWNSPKISCSFFIFCVLCLIFFDKHINIFTKKKK